MDEVNKELQELHTESNAVSDAESSETDDFLTGVCRYSGDPEECESCQ